MHGHPLPFRNDLTPNENISGTLLDFRARSKRGFSAQTLGSEPAESGPQGCAYIAADIWPPGAPPFCNAPVLLGSPYCAEHTRLCTVDPASAEGERIAITQDLAARAASPPPELDHLTPIALPEPIEDDGKLDERELPIDTRHDHVSEEEA
jgi:hypothetical protein